MSPPEEFAVPAAPRPMGQLRVYLSVIALMVTADASDRVRVALGARAGRAVAAAAEGRPGAGVRGARGPTRWTRRTGRRGGWACGTWTFPGVPGELDLKCRLSEGEPGVGVVRGRSRSRGTPPMRDVEVVGAMPASARSLTRRWATSPRRTAWAGRRGTRGGCSRRGVAADRRLDRRSHVFSTPRGPLTVRVVQHFDEVCLLAAVGPLAGEFLDSLRDSRDGRPAWVPPPDRPPPAALVAPVSPREIPGLVAHWPLDGVDWGGITRDGKREHGDRARRYCQCGSWSRRGRPGRG